MLRNWIAALVITLIGATQPVGAATFYVAPLGAAISGTPNGTLASPWPSSDVAFASGRIAAGDTVLLMDGKHGSLNVQQSFSSTVTVMSQNARMAHVENIYVGGTARNVIIKNLKVWPSSAATRVANLVAATATASDIQFVNLDVRSGQDAYSYESWSAADWIARRTNGASLAGPRIQIRQSNFTGITFGIILTSNDGVAAGNTIDGFSADALRGAGERTTFRDNYAQNCVLVDENHADGFQSYTPTVVYGLTLVRNTIIEWTLAPSHPLRCGLQGIGIFDGEHHNITINDNVIATRMGHGITVYGAHNAKIFNNTVVNIDGIQPGYPWIGIYPSKAGVPSADVVVANNLAMGFYGGNDAANRVKFTNNRIIRDVSNVFPNWKNFNYQLPKTSRYVDIADPTYATALDVLRRPRPVGNGPDLGAFEAGSTASTSLPKLVLPPPPPITATN